MTFLDLSVGLLDLMILCLIPMLIRHAKRHWELARAVKDICKYLKIPCGLEE